MADYFIQLKYENLEEDFEGGVNFVRRIAGGSQDSGTNATAPRTNQGTGPLNPTTASTPPTSAGLSYNTWDLYAIKKLGKWKLGAELPITSGKVAGVDYSAISVAGEANWRINDPWEMQFKLGRASGQPDVQANSSGGPAVDKYKAYYFNPNYHIGTIMFNYQLRNMSGYLGPNTLNNSAANQSNLTSAFDNPITNATYVSWEGLLHADKWTFDTGFVWAKAIESAKAGDFYYNTWDRQFEQNISGKDQGSNLGFEWDLGAGFQWDEYFNTRVDLGMYFPGDFYKFANSSTVDSNSTSTVYAAIFRIGVNF